MTIDSRMHRITTQNGTLEILFQKDESKIDKISLTVEETISQFTLRQICFNGQPAQHLKGFKADILKKDSLLSLEVREGKIFLCGDCPQSFNLNISHGETTFCIPVSPNLKVSGLRRMIADKLQRSDFKIYDQGEYPLEESSTLQNCKVKESSSLTLIFDEDPLARIDEENRGKGPLELGTTSLLFVNFKDELHLGFNNKAPEWRTVNKGLNLEGKCINRQCSANDQRVCVPKGFGEFHMSEESCKACCPCCQQELSDVNNGIFWDCFYELEGQKENKEKYQSEKKQAPKKTGLTFAEAIGNQSNIEKWQYLKIKTEKVGSTFCTLI